jgi:hypothetical protein
VVVAPTGAQVLARAARAGLRYRRIIGFCLVALAVVAGLWVVLQAIGGVAGGGSLTSSGAPAGTPAVAATGTSAHPVHGQVWVVQPGDTLWGIVEAAGVSGDPRPAVDKLAAEMGGRSLQVGQAITVP